jgi:hypothetical protein
MSAKLILFGILVALILISLIPKQEVLAQTQSGPYLKFIKRECVKNDGSSVGAIIVCIVIYKVENDGNTNYDWYVVQVDFQIIPGKFLYGNKWLSADAVIKLTLSYCPSYINYCIFDYSPTTTVGASTVGVSITAGFSGLNPTLSITLSWYYSVADVVVWDYSDMRNNKVHWWHNINERKDVGKYVYYMKPGFTLIFPEGYKYSLKYEFTGRFIHENTYQIVEIWKTGTFYY